MDSATSSARYKRVNNVTTTRMEANMSN
ncbi:hypothetical protein CCACVL1_10807 [Corchorus capsularis]|uniref:Uncharacterized protein n=1 Tax=Corchorus capsularis TaxID=210143 RepID=A0A1R3IPF7_COCAP|nr:hypothetical protein CCACVL1_10807 [Corchorus capsularis]